MFDDLKYRWALMKYMKQRRSLYRAYEDAPDDPEEWGDEPHVKHVLSRELLYHSQGIDYFRSKYLLEQAHRYHVPVPENDESWMQPRGAPDSFLTPAAAQKLRADIRAESGLGLLGQ